MTTIVKLVNQGSKSVKIEVQGRNDQGQFQSNAEIELEPYRFADVTVYDGQSFQVSELKD